MPTLTPPKTSRRAQFKLEMLESFTGGLNFRTDQFNLENNESLVNIDGFSRVSYFFSERKKICFC